MVLKEPNGPKRCQMVNGLKNPNGLEGIHMINSVERMQ